MRQRVEDTRKDHPYTNEARKRVLEWMHANPDIEDSDLDLSEQSNRGSRVGDSRKASIMGARIESESEGNEARVDSLPRQTLQQERVDSLPRWTRQQERVDSLPPTAR